jgi:hypothetical protein
MKKKIFVNYHFNYGGPTLLIEGCGIFEISEENMSCNDCGLCVLKPEGYEELLLKISQKETSGSTEIKPKHITKIEVPQQYYAGRA